MTPDEMKAAILAERARVLQGFTIAIYDELPSLEDVSDFKGTWKIGSSSMINRREKFRFLKAGEYIREEKQFLTYSDINFTYLKLHAREHPASRNRITDKQRRIFTHMGQTPIIAAPFEGEAIYLDLAAFHANVLIAFGRDMDYIPNEYITPLPNHGDYPYWHNKMARNRLHSTAYPSGHILMGNANDCKELGLPSAWANPALIRFTNDLSCMIAHFMTTEGKCIYANRDGYIAQKCNVRNAIHILEKIGLPYTIKEYGKSTIRSYGDYDFEPSVFNLQGHTSKRKRHPLAQHILPNLNYEWLFRHAKPIIDAARNNFIYPVHTPETLSEFNRLRG